MEDLTSPFLLNLRPFGIHVLEIIADMASGAKGSCHMGALPFDELTALVWATGTTSISGT